MDPGALVSAAREALEARREELVARSAAQRAALAEQLAPLATLDRGLEKLRGLKLGMPTAAIGTGLALSALLLALPAGRSPVVRGGVALIQLAASVRRLFARDKAD